MVDNKKYGYILQICMYLHVCIRLGEPATIAYNLFTQQTLPAISNYTNIHKIPNFAMLHISVTYNIKTPNLPVLIILR